VAEISPWIAISERKKIVSMAIRVQMFRVQRSSLLFIALLVPAVLLLSRKMAVSFFVGPSG
jgi:hypothetical protein